MQAAWLATWLDDGQGFGHWATFALDGLVLLTAAILVLGTAASLLRVPHGAIRSLDFPRLQAIGLALPTALLALSVLPLPWAEVIALAMAAVVLVQGVHVIRFTPLWRRQSLAPERTRLAKGRQVSLLAANVKLSNRAHDRLLALVARESPDIVMVIETDARWLEAILPLTETHPHRIGRALDNGYGMALYSRLPLEGAELRELLVDKVPSIRATVALPAGQRFRLHVVHPEPPVPYQDSEGRDAEIGLVGLEVGRDPMPSIVAGDLNDVAWSFTTRRFQRLSGLLDPRVGRGFYNTFDARYRLLRWPLDHLFHDPRFRLLEMRRLPDIGSDHFPMLFRLQLEPDESQGLEPGEASQEEVQEIREMARNERARDREAVGSDWESEEA